MDQRTRIEREKDFITYQTLKEMKHELAQQIKDGDAETLKSMREDMEVIETQVNKMATDLSGMRENIKNTANNTADMVVVLKETQKEQRETNIRVFGRLDTYGEKIIDHEHRIKNTESTIDKKFKDKAVLFTFLGTIGTAFLGLVGVLATHFM